MLLRIQVISDVMLCCYVHDFFMFQRIVVPPFSRIKQSKKNAYLIIWGTMFLQNFQNCSPNDNTLHHRRPGFIVNSFKLSSWYRPYFTKLCSGIQILISNCFYDPELHIIPVISKILWCFMSFKHYRAYDWHSVLFMS